MLLNYQQKQTSLAEEDQKTDNIFIIHGLFGSLSNLSGISKALQAQHNVIAVDLRNHGDSPHAESATYQEMASDIFELADKLNIDNFSVLGHSMGGKVAMSCALQQPGRINKLVVVDMAPINYTNKHQEVFDGLLAVTAGNITSRKLADQILSKYVFAQETRQFLLKSLVNKEGKYQFKFNIPDIIANYNLMRSWPIFEHVFTKEVLFIKGGNSDYIGPEAYQPTLALFPNAKAKIIENAGHWVHAEKAKTFERIVLKFFS